MKKFLVVLLAVVLVFAMAACGNNAADEDVAVGADGNVIEAETTPTDLTEEGTEEEAYAPDPSATAENETFVTDYAQAAERLGLAAVNFPEEMQIYRVLLVDEDKVQVEFYYNDKLYLGQYVVGLAENPSGMKGLFANVETAELSGENVTFEYPTVDPDNPPNPNQAGSKQLALAQTYDAESNITAWLVDNNFLDLDDFKAVTEVFLNALD